MSNNEYRTPNIEILIRFFAKMERLFQQDVKIKQLIYNLFYFKINYAYFVIRYSLFDIPLFSDKLRG